ncbi:MAG: MarR family winged helix-turn-helix transcriptional regulator [Terracidiphilus sp.]|jgi:DNA-binding MarR family transcriptional regulator
MSKENRSAKFGGRRREISAADYRKLAEFRFRIRQFLHFSEEAARSHGMEPQQHQLLLAIKGLPKGARPTVTTISERLCLRHHSTVELIDRLEKQGAVARQHGENDRREVLLHLTPRGEDWLRRLTVSIWPQLQFEGVTLSDSLKKLLAASRERERADND